MRVQRLRPALPASRSSIARTVLWRVSGHDPIRCLDGRSYLGVVEKMPNAIENCQVTDLHIEFHHDFGIVRPQTAVNK